MVVGVDIFNSIVFVRMYNFGYKLLFRPLNILKNAHGTEFNILKILKDKDEECILLFLFVRSNRLRVCNKTPRGESVCV